MFGSAYFGSAYFGSPYWSSFGGATEPETPTPPVTEVRPYKGRAPQVRNVFATSRYSTDVYDTSDPYDSLETYDGGSVTQLFSSDRLIVVPQN